MTAPDWQALWLQHQRWLRTILVARLGEPEAVEEVLQELGLAVARQQQPLRDARSAAPWLYRLAIRQVLLYRRRRGRLRRLDDRVRQRSVPEERDRGTSDPLAWLLAQERQALVRQALAQLRRRDAEMLLLKYTEGWNYHQIAQHLGLSHSAVEARLHRARQRMRRQLALFKCFEVQP